jgi:D-alanine transaminase/branched-chain amino acid aminotransferase
MAGLGFNHFEKPKIGVMVAMLNETFVAKADLWLQSSDLAIQRGYAAFDFFRTRDFSPLFLPDHLRRFYQSAAELHLQLPFSPAELEDRLHKLVAANDSPHIGIKLLLTGGYSGDGFTPAAPNLLAIPEVLPALPTQLQDGIHLISHPFQRELPHIKSTNYLTAIWLQPRIKAAGAHDVLYHQNGHVSECPRANIFMVTQAGELCTPADNILQGITRAKILALAKRHATVSQRNIAISELLAAREVFVTSTTKRVLPVVKIDGITIGAGSAGGLTTQLFHDFLALEKMSD